MAKNSLSKLFKRKPAKGDVVVEVKGTPPDAVSSAKDASKEKKKKGKARRVLMGILKKTIPCAAGKAHDTGAIVDDDESFYDQKYKPEFTPTGEYIFEAMMEAPPQATPRPAVALSENKNRHGHIVQPRIHVPTAKIEGKKPVKGTPNIQEIKERLDKVAPPTMYGPANRGVEYEHFHGRVLQPSYHITSANLEARNPNVLKGRERPEQVPGEAVSTSAITLEHRKRHGGIIHPTVYVRDFKPTGVTEIGELVKPVLVANRADALEVAEVDTTCVNQKKRRHARFVLPNNDALVNEHVTAVQGEEIAVPAVEGRVVVEGPDVVEEVVIIEEAAIVEEPAVVEDLVTGELGVVEEPAIAEVVVEDIKEECSSACDDVSLPGEVDDVVSEVTPAVVILDHVVSLSVDIKFNILAFGSVLLNVNADADNDIVPFEDNLILFGVYSMDTDFKVYEFGSLPLLDDDIIEDFINCQYLARVAFDSPTMDSPVFTEDGMDEPSDSGLSPLVDSAASEYSSSPSTPVEVQENCPEAVSDDEMSKEYAEITSSVPELDSSSPISDMGTCTPVNSRISVLSPPLNGTQTAARSRRFDALYPPQSAPRSGLRPLSLPSYLNRPESFYYSVPEL